MTSKRHDHEVVITNYEVTYEGIRNKHLEKLPWKIKETMEEAFYSVHKNPKIIIKEYEKIKNKYKNNPVLLNYLATAYSHDRNTQKVKETVIKNYEENKEYLFAKINYAQICIEDGNYGKIHEIFNGKFELKLLYPKRNIFHIDEFLNFNSTMGIYCCKIGNIEQAKIYYNMLKNVEPRNTHTKRLKKLLYPSIFRRLFLKKSNKAYHNRP